MRMFHNHHNDASDIKAPLLILLGKIFIKYCSIHDKKCSLPLKNTCLKVSTDWRSLFLGGYFLIPAFHQTVIFLLFLSILWPSFEISINISSCICLSMYAGLAHKGGYLLISFSKYWCTDVPPHSIWLFWWELMPNSSLFPILSFLPCGFLVINTGIGSNSSSATLSEPSGTSKPEMRLLSSAA